MSTDGSRSGEHSHHLSEPEAASEAAASEDRSPHNDVPGSPPSVNGSQASGRSLDRGGRRGSDRASSCTDEEVVPGTAVGRIASDRSSAGSLRPNGADGPNVAPEAPGSYHSSRSAGSHRSGGAPAGAAKHATALQLGLQSSSNEGYVRHNDDAGFVAVAARNLNSSGWSRSSHSDRSATNKSLEDSSSFKKQEVKLSNRSFSDVDSRPFNNPGNVVHTIKKCLNQTGDSPAGEDEDTLKWLKDSATGSSRPTVMRVRYNKVPKKQSPAKLEYPYHPLSEKAAAYRGYPVDGPNSLKGKKWKVQIVGASIGKPPEPLPQFPQQELLVRSGEVYRGAPKMELTAEQVAWNSGQAWLTDSKAKPTSDYFYTAGYLPGSAVQVMKPFKTSIYHTVVSGSAVEVSANDITGAVTSPGKLTSEEYSKSMRSPMAVLRSQTSSSAD